MAAERRNQYYSQNRRYAYDSRYADRMYVDGNTVRKEREYEYDRRHQENRQTSPQRSRRKRTKRRHMNMPYVIILMLATAVTLVLCLQYLQLQSSISTHKKTINSLQSELAAIQLENAAAEDSIEIYSDLELIRSIATSELGMVYPSDDQVIEYDKSESEFVRQYDEIPTTD